MRPDFLRLRFEIRMDSTVSGSRGAEQLKNLLRKYAREYENSSNESEIEQCPSSIRNCFLPYIKHIQSIDNTASCLNNVLEMNESVLKGSTLSVRFNDIMHTLKKDLSALTNDLIHHLSRTNSACFVAEDEEEIPTPRVSSPSSGDVRKFPDRAERSVSKAASIMVTNNEGLHSKRKSASDEAILKRSKIEKTSELNSTASGSLQADNILRRRDLKFNEQGKLMVFIDGACSSNGRAIAKAGYGVWFNHNHPLNISAPVEGVPTNNNAEIQAATRAILQAHSIGIKKIKLHTDSQFLINCMTQWIHKWKRNNWMTVSKQPVKNKESLLLLDGAVPLMEDIEWEYVEAHKGIAGNEEADALAKKGATMYEGRKAFI